MTGDVGKEGETVDSGRPSSPTSQAQAKREKKMTKIEAIIKKEQQVSQDIPATK